MPNSSTSDPSNPYILSLADAFSRYREQAVIIEILLVLLVLALVTTQVVYLVRRTRALRLDALVLAEQRGLNPLEQQLVLALARKADVPPMEFLTHLDVFEAVTRDALEQPDHYPIPSLAIPDVLRRIRHALHFDRLPTHAPLLTSRELSPGLAIDVNGVSGKIIDVTESSFEVELPEPPTVRTGDEVRVRFSRSRDARYELSCRVDEIFAVTDETGPGLVLRHDEAPRRQQMRRHVRVAVAVPVAMHAVSWPGVAMAPRHFSGELRDISAGGALVVSRASLPPGVILKLSFTLDEEAFSLLAVNLSSRQSTEENKFHLEFTGMSKPDRDRLLAIVGRRQRHQRADDRNGERSHERSA